MGETINGVSPMLSGRIDPILYSHCRGEYKIGSILPLSMGETPLMVSPILYGRDHSIFYSPVHRKCFRLYIAANLGLKIGAFPLPLQ